MSINQFLAFLAVVVASHQAALGSPAVGDQGVALAIIYDTSGSMKDVVRDAKGGSSPKYLIGNRALAAVASHIEAFVSGDKNIPVYAALFVFQGENVKQELPMAPFNAALYKGWAARFNAPGGNTPLGNALTAAGRCVLDSPAARKHVLVITDGLNTAGPTPAATLPKLKQQAASKQATVGVHFVAFDIDAKVFEPLKRQGVTVVGAADEKQLNSQLEFILVKKILLEDEEPVKPNK